ncbi:MAG: class I SAM-dependent methyltransferase, partial [Bacteroidetes bacterium]|nr:class I SAM-dependent methyltransferase [Bacteroidota bacterium]
INQLFPNFSETIECFAFLDGSSLPTDIALLKSLSKRFEHCKYFEIGTWRGESVINVAENSEVCYTLDLSRSEMLSRGLSEKYADLHGFFSKGKANIKHLTGSSLTFDFKGINKKFDLIFIDGSHHYDNLKSDTKNIFEHLVHEDSIIVWHDYSYTPEKLRPEVLSAILDGTPSEYRKHLYHVSNTMCAIFIRDEFPTSELRAPITPNKIFKIQIENRVIS